MRPQREPRWISLACGLAATETFAMTMGRGKNGDRTGLFPPVTRMGGKRAVAEHVLEILGTWPTRWLMVDADVAIVEFWQAVFGGWLSAVAQIIRDAPCDGEELWNLWMSEPVPVHPLERVARWQVVSAGQYGGCPTVATDGRWTRPGGIALAPWKWKYDDDKTKGLQKDLLAVRNKRLARWIVGQKGNFSARPLSYGEKWKGVAGFRPLSEAAAAAGYSEIRKAGTADRIAAFWEGVAGYASVSERGKEKGFKERFDVASASARLDDFAAGPGSAMYLDLATSSPIFREGDLVTIDPPYKGTTGYGPALTRERVVDLAEEAHACGCRVIVHETEPVLDGGPWEHVELQRRHGQNQRTWSKQRTEILTLNFEPAKTVSHAMAATRVAGGFEGPLFPAVETRV